MRKPLHTRFPGWDDLFPTVGEPGVVNANAPTRFYVMPRGRTWEVFRNSQFWGTFTSKVEARDCVRTEMQRLFSSGAAADLRFA